MTKTLKREIKQTQIFKKIIKQGCFKKVVGFNWIEPKELGGTDGK